MNRTDPRLLPALTVLLVCATARPAQAQDAIVVGDAVADPPTVCCLAVSVPITSGDADYDATATLEYRATGAPSWTPALPLLRVRPDTISEETPPGVYGLPVPAEQFAGSIMTLAPDTGYDIRISVTDPDGGNRTQTISSRTRPLPRTTPLAPRDVDVTDQAELLDAIAQAQPGDVIRIAAGIYAGPLTITASGTAQNPIVLQGVDQDAVRIAAPGANSGLVVRGSHLYVRDLSVSGSFWGATTFDTEGIVIERVRFTDVSRGISGRSGTNRNYYFCDNVLEGRFTWPNVSSATWDEEGISVSGQGHTVCHNRLSGFGDALGLANDTDIVNVSIDFFGNDVLWTGDDGMELDFAHRNVRAFGNRITNAGMGVSLQPVWGGPVYVVRNLLLNLAYAPYKLNNDPTGFLILHNTSVRSFGPGSFGGFAWPQLGYTQADGDPAYAANFRFLNNIVIGTTQPARVTTALILEEIDYNGWSPDGTFQFVDSWSDMADLKARSPYEANGRILGFGDFAVPLVLPADYTTAWPGNSMTLAAASNAIDAARPLANVNDAPAGAAPDMGALEFGEPAPAYGPRTAGDTLAPAPPTNVRVE